MHDQDRPGALQSRSRDARIRQHERRGHGEHDVAAPHMPQQCDEGAKREQCFGRGAFHQRALSRNPVSDLGDRRPARPHRDAARARRAREHQHLGVQRQCFRDLRHDGGGRARIRRVMLADDDNFSRHRSLFPDRRAWMLALSGGGRAEFRDRILQHGLDGGGIVAFDRLLERSNPFPQRLHRRLVRLGRHDAGDPDLDRRLFIRKQDFVQPLARPDAA